MISPLRHHLDARRSNRSEHPPRHRTTWAAIGAAVAVTIGAVVPGSLPRVDATLSEGGKPAFVAVTPCRLFDTRPDSNVGVPATPLGQEETLTYTVRGNTDPCPATIAADAVSLVLNVTALNATAPTFLAIWGGGDRPDSSSLNPVPGQPPAPNAVTTPLDGDGAFSVFNRFGSVDVIADVVGYHVDHDHDDIYFRKTELYTQAEVDALLAPLATKTAVESLMAKTVEAPATVPLQYSSPSPSLSTSSDVVLIRTVGTFFKSRPDSLIRLDWASAAKAIETTGTTACAFHLRVNGEMSGSVGPNAPTTQATFGWGVGDTQTLPISLTDYFRDLDAGTHTVSIWAVGEHQECVENPDSDWRTVFVTETSS